MMNRYRNNQEENHCLPKQFQGLVQDNHTLRPRAYINPQIVNCDYFKLSLCKGPVSAGKKILVNPNFRRNKVNISNLNNEGKVHLPNTNPNFYEALHIQNKKNDTFEVKKLTKDFLRSRFKKINNVVSNTKYTWSNSNSISNSPLIATRPKEYTSPSSSYKYTAPKRGNLKKINVLTSTNLTSQNKKSPPIFVSKTKLINKLKTKIVRNGPNKTKSTSKATVSPKFVYNRYKKSPAVRVASLVRNKYKYNKLARSTRFKVDKRKKSLNKKKLINSSTQDIRKLFPTNFYNRTKLSSNYYVNLFYKKGSVPKNICSWRKEETSKNVQNKINRFPNKRVVKIGGILYKSTVNKLTKTHNKNEDFEKAKLLPPKEKKNHIVYVRGEKFILDRSGKTLKRQIGNSSDDKTSNSTPKRIDIGGVTYMKKSDNVLVRTNVHQARHLVNKAKHKSIATLTNLYKRSTMPCMIFHKFGKCSRHTKGLCMYKHDLKNVAICKKFLKGKCNDEKCLLSHEVTQEKMATCHFFLKGTCTRENCPFLHVKLNKNVEICEKFLQGFCALGKNCPKRHFFQCPEFDKFGTCSQNKCLYPHKKKSKLQGASASTKLKKVNKVKHDSKTLPIAKAKREKTKKSSLKSQSCDKVDAKKENINKRSSNELIENHDQNDDAVECIPKRIKLDKLPCFIPLKSDSE